MSMAQQDLLAASGVPRKSLGNVQVTDAAGTATLRFGRPDAGTYWLIDRGRFIVNAPGGGTLVWIVYTAPEAIDLDIEDFVQVSVGAAGSIRVVGEWLPPIWVPSSGELIAVVTGADPAVQARGKVIARVMKDNLRPS